MRKAMTILILLAAMLSTATEITVYGRNSCGFTANLQRELTAANIPYTYCNIDSAGCLGAMFGVVREFNLAPSGTVNLPVVLVVTNDKRYGYVRPSLADILKITSSDVTRRPTIAYPNPCDQFITVTGECRIFDLTGRMVLKSHDRHISISGLPQGIYFVRVGNKTTKITKR